jgi:hypothetical protein
LLSTQPERKSPLLHINCTRGGDKNLLAGKRTDLSAPSPDHATAKR